MDINDVKVGMLVQMNGDSSKDGCIGVVEGVDYLDELCMLRLEGITTNSQFNTSTVHNRWNVKPRHFNEYQDPEADMVVWDALEIGEHFINHTGQEAVKITTTQFVVLERAVIYTVIQSKIGQLTKYKLV